MKEIEMLLKEAMGEQKLQAVCEDLAEIVRKHELHAKPIICHHLFAYMSDVVRGWNERKRSQVR